MKLTFKNEELKLLLNSAHVRWPLGLRECYADEIQGKPVPGFWLVGDDGVYLMHNGTLPDGGVLPFVVYAEECNPKTMPFDEWWNNKNASFGADDGAEFIARDDMEKLIATGNDLEVVLDQNMISVGEIITDTSSPYHPDNRGFDGPTGAE
jgi:hypothetical protein